MIAAVFRAALLGGARLLTGLSVSGPAPQEDGSPFIFFAEHGSHLDTLLILAALPPALRARTHPVAARDYWGATPSRRFVACKVLGAVLIDRQPQSDQDTLAPVCDVLRQGHSVILYPQGTRAPAQAGFKSGLYRLLQRVPGSRSVPVRLENFTRVLPKGCAVPLPLLCALRFGSPIGTEAGEEKDGFLHRARHCLEHLASTRECAT